MNSHNPKIMLRKSSSSPKISPSQNGTNQKYVYLTRRQGASNMNLVERIAVIDEISESSNESGTSSVDFSEDSNGDEN